jgi:predicted ATPase
LSSFVGRQQELPQICELLTRTRLLTLVGVGGVGKTRLALELVRELEDAYPDGVSVAELAALTTGSMLKQTIATAVGVRDKPGQSLVQTLIMYLESRCSLLVLDNCEHLLAECAELADELLRGTGQVTILATSREALRITGETVFAVPTLEVADPITCTTASQAATFSSTRLFVERAAAITPQFALSDDNAQGVAHVCAQLDGLPLAIELAAARVSSLGLEQIRRRLDHRLRLLTAGARTAPLRQQTLRATFDWSYALLSESERLLFDRLAVFAGQWTLEAAEKITPAGSIGQSDVMELIARLVDKSLVVAESAEGGSMRYRLLEPLREYAAEHVSARGETQELASRHANYFMSFAERADKEARGPGMRAWQDAVELERANLNAALSWASASGSDETGLKLVAALAIFWMTRRYWTEGLGWFEVFLNRPACRARTSARAHALDYAGIMAGHRNDLESAEARLNEGAAIARELHVAGPIGGLGWLRGFRGHPDEAAELFDEDVRMARQCGDRLHEAISLRMLSDALLSLHNQERARAVLIEDEIVARELGNPFCIGMALNGLGDLARWEGDYCRARGLYEQSLACFRDARSDLERSVLQNLGYVAHRLGEDQQAVSFALEALSQFRRDGDPRGTAECLVELGGVIAALGHPLQATRLFGAAESLLKVIHSDLTPLCRAEYERDLALTHDALDDEDFARGWAEGEVLPLQEIVANAREFMDAEIASPVVSGLDRALI